jgi:hypothetical protein
MEQAGLTGDAPVSYATGANLESQPGQLPF